MPKKKNKKAEKVPSVAAAASAMSLARWAKPEWRDPKARTEFHKLITRNIQNAGRKRDPNRCPCGAMTAARAAKRKHKCSKTRAA